MKLSAHEGGGRAAAVLRWSFAGLLIVAAHGGAGWWVLKHPIIQTPPDTVQGIPIDLEPTAVPQNAPEPNATTAAGETSAAQVAAAPEPMPETQSPAAPPPEPPPLVVNPPPTPEPAPAPEPTPAPIIPDPRVAPETPPIALPQQDTKSDAVLAPPPKPQPTPPKPTPPKRDPRVIAREAARKKAIAERREQQRAERVEARAQAYAAQARQSGGQGPQDIVPSSASSGASVASWRGAVVAHLNAFKPAAPNGATGTARVSFSVDRGGRVLSESLADSSGDSALDAAAVAMVRRASPVPAPPPELGGRVTLAVPVYFH